jgi:hypothetical protein
MAEAISSLTANVVCGLLNSSNFFRISCQAWPHVRAYPLNVFTRPHKLFVPQMPDLRHSSCTI